MESPLADPTAWLDQRHYSDLDPRAEKALRFAGLSWHEDAQAERWLAEAESIAPTHLAVVVANYRYRLYKHRFEEARIQAERCLCLSAAELGLAQDYRMVTEVDARFTDFDPRVRFWLFALQAYGYVLLRCGRREDGMQALGKVLELDRGDQTKTRVLVDVILRGARDAESG
jgi:hypothetical protein